jgi:hypothetical protein
MQAINSSEASSNYMALHIPEDGTLNKMRDLNLLYTKKDIKISVFTV